MGRIVGWTNRQGADLRKIIKNSKLYEISTKNLMAHKQRESPKNKGKNGSGKKESRKLRLRKERANQQQQQKAKSPSTKKENGQGRTTFEPATKTEEKKTETVLTSFKTEFMQNPKGLANLGNTCFFNSTMQCILSNLHLMKYHYIDDVCNPTVFSIQNAYKTRLDDVEIQVPQIMLNLRQPEETSIFWMFNKFIEDYERLESSPITRSIRTLFEQISRRVPRFRGWHQQDAHELLRYLMDILRQEEIERFKHAFKLHFNTTEFDNKKTSTNKMKIHPNNAGSMMNGIAYDKVGNKGQQQGAESNHNHLICQALIEGPAHPKLDDYYGGILQQTIACSRCGNFSVSLEPFFDLSLPLKSTSSPYFNPIQPETTKFKNEEKHPVKGKGKARREQQKQRQQKKQTKDRENGEKGLEEREETEEKGEEEEDNEQKEDKKENGEEGLEEKEETEEKGEKEDNKQKEENNVEGEQKAEKENEEDEKIDANRDGCNRNGIDSELDLKSSSSSSSENINNDEIEEEIFGESSKSATGGHKKHFIKLTQTRTLAELYLETVNGHEKNNQERDDGQLSIHQALSAFTATETLFSQTHSYRCENCRKQAKKAGRKPPSAADAFKRYLIWTPPLVLTLHLKRFEQTNSRAMRKFNAHVDFPLTLDLASFCSEHVNRIQRGQSSILYQLYGIVSHSGGLNGGHYVAFVRRQLRTNTDEEKLNRLLELASRDAKKSSFLSSADQADQLSKKLQQMSIENGGANGCCHSIADNCMRKNKALEEKTLEVDSEFSTQSQWFYCSDSNVTRVTEERVLAAQAYLLFYERIY